VPSGPVARIPAASAILLGLGCTLPFGACLAPPPNAGCPGDCLCYATAETCPVGCDPTYDILPDGGGTGEFSCRNPPQTGQDAEPEAAALAPCPAPDGSIPDAAVPGTALPSGACSGSESCSAVVSVVECPGLFDGWTCACIDGTWVCEITSAGTTLCAPDAAMDAAEGDASVARAGGP